MRNYTLGLAALAITVLAGHALGQNALGDGRGLEKDLRVGGVGEGSTGNAPRANFMNEVRARNAAVTGNAANGRSLQINKPYSAPDDFRGFLSTDDLFAFRRDSLSSAVGYRGVQGMAYQNTYATGLAHARASTVTRLETFGSGSELQRAGPSIRNAANEPAGRRTDRPDVTAPKLEEPEAKSSLAAPVGSMRSTGAFSSTMNLTPAVVGYQQEETGQVSRVTASSLLGVRLTGMQNKYTQAQVDRLTDRQQAELPPEKRVGSAAGPDMSTPSANLPAVNPAFRTSYDDLNARIKAMEEEPKPITPETKTPGANEKPAGTQSEKPGTTGAKKQGEPTVEERIQKLRERLQGTKENAKPGSTQPKQPGEIEQPDGAKKANQPRPSTVRKDDKYPLAGLDDETLEIIRKAGGETRSYTSGEANTLFAAHMKAGEDALAKGQYFDAEERFARALAMKPGDPTVQAARMNAQIGAGLYLSAATNLRQLYRDHPEVIGVHYKDATLPSAARVATLMQEFRDNISSAKRDSLAIPDESALLLAYIGFQVGDAAGVREGITALKKSPNAASDQLLPVLEGVWVGKDK